MKNIRADSWRISGKKKKRERRKKKENEVILPCVFSKQNIMFIFEGTQTEWFSDLKLFLISILKWSFYWNINCSFLFFSFPFFSSILYNWALEDEYLMDFFLIFSKYNNFYKKDARIFTIQESLSYWSKWALIKSKDESSYFQSSQMYVFMWWVSTQHNICLFVCFRFSFSLKILYI